MEITEEAARIMKESGSDEIVYYSKELDMYIWGITHYGTSWKLMLTQHTDSRGQCSMNLCHIPL